MPHLPILNLINMPRLTPQQIDARLATMPVTSRPRSSYAISRQTNIPISTLKDIERRALEKIRPLVRRRAGTQLFDELCDALRARRRGTPAKTHSTSSGDLPWHDFRESVSISAAVT